MKYFKVNFRTIFLVFALLGICFFNSCKEKEIKNKKTISLVDYVDPMIGTAAHGHTFPGATTSFGMVQLSPSNDFKSWDWCSGYHYTDSIIKGFAHNHISGAGLSGLGDILVIPTMGKKTTESGSDALVDKSYRSRFSHETESARAGYYAVTLEDYNIDVELTATPRSGFHKYTFNTSGEADVVIDPTHALLETAAETAIEIVSDSEIRGYKKVSMNGGKNRYMYFSAKFSKPFKNAILTRNDKEVEALKLVDTKVKCMATFDVQEKEQLEVVVTLSPVDYKGVEMNYEAEAKGKNFNETLKETTLGWNSILNKVMLGNTTSDARKRTFYTAMYHSFISPNIISDVDGRYVVEGEIYESKKVQYSNFSTWDTYRAQQPLLNLLDQESSSKMVNSLISRDTQAKVGQPVWELFGFDNACMIGYSTAAVIGDAVLKDVKGINKEEAFNSMYQSAFDLTKHSAVYDVSGLKDYINYGFVTAETGSSVSKTTEYNYHDFVIAKVADKLGKEKEAQEFFNRSIGYRSLYNEQDGYLYPVYSNGSMNKIDITKWDGLIPNYVSGNIWAYSAYTPHDMQGIIQLHGGKEKYGKWLDKIFSDTTELGGAQHVDISGFIGKYGHGDEPGHQMPYLYNYVGQPWKGQKHINNVLTTMYKDTPDGLINNEDLGQMSAWYIFSALGFYPVSPADLTYQIGAPLQELATINLENGNQFLIKAVNCSKENFYVQSLKLNGKEYNKTFMEHKTIMTGGTLEFIMGSTPNEFWGATEESASIGKISKTVPKVIAKAAKSPYDTNTNYYFSETHLVSLESAGEDTEIYYTLDGSEPNKKSQKYTEAFKISKNCMLKAIAIERGLNSSKIYEKQFFKSVFPLLKTGFPVIRMNQWGGPSYGEADGSMLFDELTGSKSYGDAKWTGLKKSFDIEIDLGSSQLLSNMSVGVLYDTASWIFPASKIEVYGGETANNLKPIGGKSLQEKSQYNKEVVRQILKLDKGNYRYLKIVIKPFGLGPDWHGSTGKKVWLFIDEINLF